MKNCAFIQSNGIEFRLPMGKVEGNPYVARISNKFVYLPNDILYSQVEEITICAGTKNLSYVIYYKDGNQNNMSPDNRIRIWCTLDGNMSTRNYDLKEIK